MPSEVLLPGVAVVLTMMLIASTLVSVLMYSSTSLLSSMRDHANIMLRSKLNRILITNAEAIATNINENTSTYRIDFVIYIYNEGSEPIYDMNKCDLMIQYYTVSNGVEVVRLTYGENWRITEVFLTDNYAISFNSKNSIGPGELGVIEGHLVRDNIDISKPIKMLFTSHYGYTASRWVSLGP
ncbi:MAG: hypothetical protein QXU97_02670 [Fervidicoccaceae archaeon]